MAAFIPIPKLTRVFGLYEIIRRMDFVNLLGRQHVEDTTYRLAFDLYNAIKADISLPALGSSPEEHFYALKKLGFPFRIEGPGATVTGGTKPTQVHEVTGRMLRALHVVRSRQADRTVFRVGFDIREAPEAHWVIHGTSTMMPRDIISGPLALVRKSAKSQYRAAIKLTP